MHKYFGKFLPLLTTEQYLEIQSVTRASALPEHKNRANNLNMINNSIVFVTFKIIIIENVF